MFAESIISNPSPDNATEWKVTLSNGSVYSGSTTPDHKLNWDVSGLPNDELSGNFTFVDDEWVLTEGGSTSTLGTVQSDPVIFDFELMRNKLDILKGKGKINMNSGESNLNFGE
mgnify:CR=1 FL=1